jgi:hypothetical protein
MLPKVLEVLVAGKIGLSQKGYSLIFSSVEVATPSLRYSGKLVFQDVDAVDVLGINVVQSR